jgi:prepilin-type N-terminal cleavage/methylation domain-containing protein
MTTMRGFTLIELLVVIGIIVILMAAAIVAINPFRQFAMANNAARWSGITTIMNAISQRIVDERGRINYNVDDPATPGDDFPVTDCPAAGDDVPTTTAAIIGSDIAGGQYNICPALIPTYLAVMPHDPFPQYSYTDCTSYNTGYNILCNTTTKRITICAPDTQRPPESAVICITR